MLVLHAARIAHDLWLWAEAPLEASPEGTAATHDGPRPGGIPPVPEPASGDPPPFLPFDAGPERLTRGLDEAAGGFRPHRDRFRERVGWFPVRGRRPVPSTPLVTEPPGGPGRMRLRPFRVTALRLDPEEALTLLATVSGRRTLGPGLPVSRDLAYWAEALRLTGTMLAAGHVLPGLVEGREGFEARWDPVFREDDLEALGRLAREMPGAARALVDLDVSAAPDPGASSLEGHEPSSLEGHEPSSLEGLDASSLEQPNASPLEGVRGFIAGMCDHLVRSAQWPHGILPMPVDAARSRGPAPAGENAGTVDERWLRALRTPDPVVPGKPGELRNLQSRLKDWRRPLTRILDAPWRLSFRLREPEGTKGNGASWPLDYFLQDVHEPSLLVPLETVWTTEGGNGSETRTLLRHGTHPREHLLQDLGQAARLSPVVRESLEGARPTGAELDGASAYRFLREEAPLLGEAGFGVHLPSWWTRDRRRIKPSVRAVVKESLQAGAGLSAADLARVHWEVILGGEGVSAEELRELAKLKAPLVRFRGEWVEVDSDELARTLAELERAEEEGVSASRLVRMAVGAEEGPGDLPVEEVRAEGALGRLLEGLQGKAEFRTLPPPDGLQARLRPYQQRGYSWLAFLTRWGLGACLADDMGLGKTVQTLALVQQSLEEAKRPVLVICPTSVVTNWKREAGRFTPALRVRIHHGPDRPLGEALEDAAAEADLVLTTYGLLFRDAEELARIPWRGVVLDEAQNIKNPDTQRARAARALPADFRIALTGTPVENHVGDLWSIMETLNPGLLGNRASFRRRFFLPIQSTGDSEAAARLRRITGPFILRRLKTDRSIIRDLPERIESRAFCTLTREQASLYAAVLEELEESLGEGTEGMARKGLVLATLTRLKQVCNHPAQFLDDGSSVAGRSGKVERMVELLEEVLETDGRALVFTQYTRMGEILQKHLQNLFGETVPFLHGGVSRACRERMVDRFQQPGGPGVFLLSLKAGGTGLNLTAANHVFLFDRWWNPAVETQAADRAFRIGQRRKVQVHKFVCTGTLEEQIDRIIEGKREVAGKVVGTGDAWLTELSNDELRDVLALRT